MRGRFVQTVSLMGKQLPRGLPKGRGPFRPGHTATTTLLLGDPTPNEPLTRRGFSGGRDDPRTKQRSPRSGEG